MLRSVSAQFNSIQFKTVIFKRDDVTMNASDNELVEGTRRRWAGVRRCKCNPIYIYTTDLTGDQMITAVAAATTIIKAIITALSLHCKKRQDCCLLLLNFFCIFTVLVCNYRRSIRLGAIAAAAYRPGGGHRRRRRHPDLISRDNDVSRYWCVVLQCAAN